MKKIRIFILASTLALFSIKTELATFKNILGDSIAMAAPSPQLKQDPVKIILSKIKNLQNFQNFLIVQALRSHPLLQGATY